MDVMPIIVLSLLSMFLGQSRGQLKAEIDEFVETVLNCTDIPGLSLTVVRDNQASGCTFLPGLSCVFLEVFGNAVICAAFVT